MNDNIVEFPEQSNQELDNFFGVPDHPSWHSVTIEGRRIPRMKARQDGDKYEVLLDDRWCYIFDDKGSAYSAARMAANAMAIGMGYPWLGASNKEMPFAPQLMPMDNPLLGE